VKSDIKTLLDNHQQLNHSEHVKVISHVQREQDDWILNTVMIEDVNTAFKYKRKKIYKSLKDQRVNITYYRDTETVAGFDIEIMNIVRIKIA
jgi:hypothetical protein